MTIGDGICVPGSTNIRGGAVGQTEDVSISFCKVLSPGIKILPSPAEAVLGAKRGFEGDHSQRDILSTLPQHEVAHPPNESLGNTGEKLRYSISTHLPQSQGRQGLSFII